MLGTNIYITIFIAGIDGGFSTTMEDQEQQQEHEDEDEEEAERANDVGDACVAVPVTRVMKEHVRQKSDSMTTSEYYRRMVELEDRKVQSQERYYAKMIALDERKTLCLEKETKIKMKFLEKKLSLLNVNTSPLNFYSDVLETGCHDT